LFSAKTELVWQATLSCFGAYYQEDVLGILMERVKEHSLKNRLVAFYEALELKKII
jgi:hypothetical protein